MNKINTRINNYINENGKIFLDKFIEICLYDRDGYYKKYQPIGKNSDFITSPEISQLFGEIIGLYIYNNWHKYFQCDFNLIELGPGQGTLMSDILRINNNFNYFLNSANINLVEINNELIKLQKKNILTYRNKVANIEWLNNFDYITHKPSIIIANEFFDCFPIKQFIKINKKWNEKAINYNKNDKRYFIYNSSVENNLIKQKLNKIANKNHFTEDKIIEISDYREKYFNKLCKFINKNYGQIIVVDYGYLNPVNHSTLQSVSLHKSSNLLDNLGNQDITSHIDFASFVEIAKKNKLDIYGPITQKEFLINNGISFRKNIILKNATEKNKFLINKGCDRLLNEHAMGIVFKFLIVSKKKLNHEQ